MIIEIDIASAGESDGKKKDRYPMKRKNHLFRQILTRDLFAVDTKQD